MFVQRAQRKGPSPKIHSPEITPPPRYRKECLSFFLYFLLFKELSIMGNMSAAMERRARCFFCGHIFKVADPGTAKRLITEGPGQKHEVKPLRTVSASAPPPPVSQPPLHPFSLPPSLPPPFSQSDYSAHPRRPHRRAICLSFWTGAEVGGGVHGELTTRRMQRRKKLKASQRKERGASGSRQQRPLIMVRGHALSESPHAAALCQGY